MTSRKLERITERVEEEADNSRLRKYTSRRKMEVKDERIEVNIAELINLDD